jgi:hypothetical protein
MRDCLIHNAEPGLGDVTDKQTLGATHTDRQGSDVILRKSGSGAVSWPTRTIRNSSDTGRDNPDVLNTHAPATTRSGCKAHTVPPL